MEGNNYSNSNFVNDDENSSNKNDNKSNNENDIKTQCPEEEIIKPNSTDRATWGNSLEFLMSCIAMNVGLGNIWRFPFVAYENGGGAFLIPYILVLIFVGRPMYYLEMCLGQFCSRGNVKMFESLAPILKGIGYGQLIGTACVASYYCSLMALTLFYLVNSFTSHLPWSECNSDWVNETWMQNLTCIPSITTGHTELTNTISSSELWFKIEVLKESYYIDDGIGYPEWRLTICLFVAWLITFLVCAKGVQTSGKVSYFLAIFPFVILFALLVRAVTLEGADKGILYFIEPKWEQLLNAKVWYSAVTQCFFSLNVGFGSVTMYASYNNFQHNVYRDAMIVTTLDTCTSFLAGLIIFGILGNLAYKLDVEVNEVVKSGGTGLAFISYPEAIARFESVPWLFAILFFFMLFVLGLGSQVAIKSCVFTAIMDSFPHLKIWHVSLATAIFGFLIGLVYITPGGQYIFTMIDFFGGTFIFFVMNICEIVSIIWWYGLENICLDIEFMSKRKPGPYWRICWSLIIPVILICIFIYFVVTLEELTYDSKPYPTRVIAWGWVLLGFGIVQPIVWWIIEILKKIRKEECSTIISKTLKHDNWGPKDPSVYVKWTEFKFNTRQTSKFRNSNWFVKKWHILIGK